MCARLHSLCKPIEHAGWHQLSRSATEASQALSWPELARASLGQLFQTWADLGLPSELKMEFTTNAGLSAIVRPSAAKSKEMKGNAGGGKKWQTAQVEKFP